MMKAIQAEDSDLERGSQRSSEDNSDGNAEEGEEELEEEEEEVVDNNRQSPMDEREAMKKNLQQKQAIRKEEEELIGPRLVKKIDDFIFGVAVEAGMDAGNADEESKSPNYRREKQQEEMLQTGNTSQFNLEKTKNDDQGVYQKVMDQYVTELRSEQAFFQLCKMAKDSKFTDPELNNPLVQYYNECVKANTVAKPLLSKIVDR